MTRLEWGVGPRQYERGVDQGVLYLDGTGVPWNGVVSVDEQPSGFVNAEHYFDGTRLHISQDTSDFEAVVSAYTYPDAFAEYNGYSEQEIYKRFGLCYRTQHQGGYRLHIVYNALVQHNERSWETLSERANPSLFRWKITGTPVPIPGASPASRITMEAPNEPDVLAQIENVLYGTAGTNPRLPDPAELIDLYEVATMLRITYHQDGSYTASGPDSMVRSLEDGHFELNAPSVFFIDHDVFVVNSY